MSEILFSVRCAECHEVIAYTGAQPYGYMICPSCKESQGDEACEGCGMRPAPDGMWHKPGCPEN